MDNIIGSSNAQKIKSFWSKPEGITGMVFIVASAIGIVMALPWISMILGLAIGIFGKLIALGLMGTILFLFVAFITSDTCKLIFQNLMRKITGFVIETDPIGVMKSIISQLQKKKKEMDENISQLSGTIRIIDEKAKKSKAGYEDALRGASVAKNKGSLAQFSLKAKSADRMEKTAITYQQMSARMVVLYNALKKYQEATEITIIDLTEEVAVKSDERNAIIAANKAMNGAMSILKGAGKEMEIFNQAMEFTVNDSLMKIGEIEDFMATTRSIIEGMDLQQGVYDEKALEKLSEWESKADSLLLGDTKRLMTENNLNNTVIENVKYKKYFETI